MPDPRLIQPTKVGKYVITRSLGQGAMGVVYEGFDQEVDRRVAVKTIKSPGLDDVQFEQLVSRLRREAQAAGRLHHTNITGLYEFGVDTLSDPSGKGTPTPFIAMEFIEGQDLAAYFRSGHSMSALQVKGLMIQLLNALEYAHARGVIHRDIKPSNIVRMRDGTIKLTDFGIARLESSTLTHTGSVLGTPCYMAPEQFRGETVDARADLYAAGVLLFQLLTGEVPFDGTFATIMYKVLNEKPKPPSLLNAGLPQEVDAIVLRAIAKNPDERFASAAEFRHAVLEANFGDGAAPLEALRRPWAIWAAVALGVSAAIAVASGWLLRGSSESKLTPVAAAGSNSIASGPALAVPAPSLPTHIETAVELEQSYWNHIKDSRDAADFRDYVRRFPQGVHAAEAALLRRKLQPKAQEARLSEDTAAGSRAAEPEAPAARTPHANLGRLPVGTYAAGYTMRSHPGSRYPTRFTFFGEGQFYALGQHARIDGALDLSNESLVTCTVTMTDLNQLRTTAQSCVGRLSGGILQLQIDIGSERYLVAIDATRRVAG